MISVQVSTKKPYEVIIGSGILSQLGMEVSKVHKVSKALIVTDENVEKFYLNTVKESLYVAGFEVFEFVHKAGEKNKTAQTYLSVIESMAQNEFGRDDLLLGLGGGVVGDITGFAAATYMRGIDFVQVPTTLLSAIDSSVGGKTGVDLPQGKNLLGAFWQPKLVHFDSNTLSTLPTVELQNGIGEAIKYAVLSGGEIWEILEQGVSQDNILRLVELCVIVKRDIVVEDEFESGKRKLLNLGHTFGHAIEKLSNFEIAHGVAVAKGIYIVARASARANILPQSEFEKISELLKKYDFDTSCEFSVDKVLEVVKMDKKVDHNRDINFVDIVAIGHSKINKMSLEALKRHIKSC